MWITTMFRNCMRGLTKSANSCKNKREQILLSFLPGFAAVRIVNSQAQDSVGNVAECEGDRAGWEILEAAIS